MSQFTVPDAVEHSLTDDSLSLFFLWSSRFVSPVALTSPSGCHLYSYSLMRNDNVTTTSLFLEDITLLLLPLLVCPKQGVREQGRTFDCSGWMFHTDKLIFITRNVLVAWMKSSNQGRGLKLTWSLTAVNQTGWLLHFSNGSRSNLNVTLHVKNRSH